MERTKVLITVENGIITNISSNKDGEEIQIVIVDYDNLENGGDVVSGILAPDDVIDDLYTLFTDENDPMNVEIHDELKRLHF